MLMLTTASAFFCTSATKSGKPVAGAATAAGGTAAVERDQGISFTARPTAKAVAAARVPRV